MMKKPILSAPSAGFGTASLLVIFCVVCIAVFAVLTLSTAQAEKRLSDAAAQAAAAYYEADNQAEVIFSLLRSGQNHESVHWNGNICSYSVPISRHQTLQVQLQKENNSWTVLCWQSCVSSEPEYQQSMSLWDGNTLEEVSP